MLRLYFRRALLIGSNALLAAACSADFFIDSAEYARRQCEATGRCDGGAQIPDTGVGEGGSDARGGATGGKEATDSSGPPSCATSGPPPRPGATTATGTRTFVVVQKSIDFGDQRADLIKSPADFLRVGWNVDGVCSTATDLRGECSNPNYAAGVPDGPGGIDNAFAGLMQQLRNLTGAGSEAYTDYIQTKSASNLLVQVSEYNGLLDDDRVTASVWTGGGATGLAADGGAPKFDGTDVWDVSSESVANGVVSNPRSADANAFVANGKVVASFPAVAIRLDLLGLAFLDLNVLEVTLECDVAASGDTLERCIFVGRVPVNDLVHQISRFPDPESPAKSICMDTNGYGDFRNFICALVDVSATGASPGNTCAALSMAFSFDTAPVLLGNVVALPPPAPACTPTTNPVDDYCGKPLSSSTGGAGGTTGTGGFGGVGGFAGSGGTSGSGGAGTGGRQCTATQCPTTACGPIGPIGCCKNDGTCGCTWAPGAVCY